MTATGRAIALTMNSASLRRAQLSFALIWAAEWAVMVTLGVVAFRDGGSAAVGVVTALRMLPAALLAPFAAVVADAVRRERVLACVGVSRAAMLGAAAVVLALDGPLATVCALMVLATIAQTLYRPTHSALLPALCAGPDELTAANLVRGLLDSLATLAGPLAAAAGLAISGPATVFAASAACSLWAGLLVVGLPYQPPPTGTPADRRPRLAGRIPGDRRRPRPAARHRADHRADLHPRRTQRHVGHRRRPPAGDRAAGGRHPERRGGRRRAPRLVPGLLLVRPGRLAMWLGIGVALWGLPVAGIGAVPQEAAAIALLAVVGIGNALVDVGAFTLPARLADESVIARVFAGFEGILTLGVAAGAALAPVVIELLGIRGALMALGLVGPVSVAVAWPALRRLDVRMRVRDADIRLLRMVPVLRPLSQATIEQLAAALEHTAVAAGRHVFEQGAIGDRAYVVEAGSAEVIRDGRLVQTLQRGACFGELALLRGCARSATVRAAATTPLDVAILPGDRFLTAVTGHVAPAAARERAVASRLRALDRIGALDGAHV